MTRPLQVVDLFAGPGGLGEGFSALRDSRGEPRFKLAISVEKEPSAHRTLVLRAFLRRFQTFPTEYYDSLNERRDLPDWSRVHPLEWEKAQHEALRLELGTPEAAAVLNERIDRLREAGEQSVLIGGPPCQAYSLAGRARNRGVAGYVPEQDKRHYLYEEYIRILDRLEPVAFVMENVKGILSSAPGGRRVFDRISEDLQNAGRLGYRLYALSSSQIEGVTLRPATSSADFLVMAEAFGVPQARHRVIVVGLRADRARSGTLRIGPSPKAATVGDVLGAMAPLRSRLSSGDCDEAWLAAVLRQLDRLLGDPELRHAGGGGVLPKLEETRNRLFGANIALASQADAPSPPSGTCPEPLRAWLTDDRLQVTLQHGARSHMEEDLGRYLFCSAYRAVVGRSATAREFPASLAPRHANWRSGHFVDRFRAQGWDAPSSTVTSHIAKDGHYFIHPDPAQCRALTVREAARLQTFPDNYLFLGNRTQQYTQVGNAVPPFLASQIADAVLIAST